VDIIDEVTLRRTLFEETGGSYPELITRDDIKLFMPPIGGLTVYIFGNPAKTADPSVKLALRVHDECNGSDVFGSDICTCRPYLIFGIEEAVKQAQAGGSGVIVYFRKEGRALGEVTKYLVYNARKRGLDKASEYFKRTEDIAGVKDMRFQALMPDVLHWLGIQKIDTMRKFLVGWRGWRIIGKKGSELLCCLANMFLLLHPSVSMSDMKHDAIVSQGIPIHKRVEIPPELIPADSMVEIGAKIAAGYYSGTQVTDEELENIQGRNWAQDGGPQWEDLDVSLCFGLQAAGVPFQWCENWFTDRFWHTALSNSVERSRASQYIPVCSHQGIGAGRKLVTRQKKKSFAGASTCKYWSRFNGLVWLDTRLFPKYGRLCGDAWGHASPTPYHVLRYCRANEQV
jgi:GTP cyclohydrolase II